MNICDCKRLYLWLSGLFLIVVLAGCNMPGRGGEDQGLMATLARQTVSARLTQAYLETQVASGQAPAPTNTPVPGATATLENTSTPAFTNTPGPPPTNTPIPCNWAQFVSDVTIPDETQFVTGTAFTKTWRLRNVGSCDWTSGYRVIFDSGDQMNAPFETQFTGGIVSYGNQVDISVNLVAPSSPGTYIGYFKLRSPDNQVFGTGSNADGNFWVKIVAIAPSPTATMTSTSTETPTPTLTYTPTATATTVSLADLIITDIALNPDPPTNGNSVDVSVTVYNQGNAIAVGPFNVDWYPGENYPSPECTWSVSNVNPNGGRVLNCTYATGYPSPYPGGINTKAIADPADSVSESDETNNSMLKSVIVN